MLQLGLVPLKRWHDMFTGVLPRLLRDRHKMADKLLHDRFARKGGFCAELPA